MSEYLRKAPKEDVLNVDRGVLDEMFPAGGQSGGAPSGSAAPVPSAVVSMDHDLATEATEEGSAPEAPAAAELGKLPSALLRAVRETLGGSDSRADWLPTIWKYGSATVEMLLRAHNGAALQGYTQERLLKEYFRAASVSDMAKASLLGPTERMFREHLAKMRADPEVGVAFTTATVAVPVLQTPRTPVSEATRGYFRASMPSLKSFAGDAASVVTNLHALTEWVSSVKTVGSLAGLSGADLCQWAGAHLIGSAQRWWLSLSTEQHSAFNVDQLQRALAYNVVTSGPFDVLEEHLQQGSLMAHASFEEYRTWVSHVRASLILYQSTPEEAITERQWVRIVIRHVRGTQYSEDVALDPVTKEKPASWSRILQLLDERHLVLRQLKQEWSRRPLRLVDDSADSCVASGSREVSVATNLQRIALPALPVLAAVEPAVELGPLAHFQDV